MNREKFTFEYIFHTTPNSLFKFISTPSGLSKWFADRVEYDNKSDEHYVVWWGKTSSRIKILSTKENRSVKYCWEEDEDSDYFFKMKISYDELTKVISLKITDFAEKDEQEDYLSIWDANIKRLKQKLGSK